MKHVFRFFGKFEGGQWSFSESEFKHLATVVRLKEGDQFEAIDGKGRLDRVLITDIAKRRLVTEVVSSSVYDPSPYSLSIRVGALKPSSAEEILSPLVETGATQVLFFLQKGVERARLSDKLREKFVRKMIEAVKQSKRLFFPELVFCKSLEDSFKSDDKFDLQCFLDHEAQVSLRDFYSKIAGNVDASIDGNAKKNDEQEKTSTFAPPKKVCFYVGGEKGWDDAEKALLIERGLTGVALHGHVLKAKTASVAASVLGAQLLRQEAFQNS